MKLNFKKCVWCVELEKIVNQCKMNNRDFIEWIFSSIDMTRLISLKFAIKFELEFFESIEFEFEFFESKWAESEWAESEWTESEWAELEWTESKWTESEWTESRWTESKWHFLFSRMSKNNLRLFRMTSQDWKISWVRQWKAYADLINIVLWSRMIIFFYCQISTFVEDVLEKIDCAKCWRCLRWDEKLIARDVENVWDEMRN
jgi:hypothetical protein